LDLDHGRSNSHFAAIGAGDLLLESVASDGAVLFSWPSSTHWRWVWRQDLGLPRRIPVESASALMNDGATTVFTRAA